jgi:hypothetical protein
VISALWMDSLLTSEDPWVVDLNSSDVSAGRGWPCE